MKNYIQILLLSVFPAFTLLSNCAANLPVIFIGTQSAVHFRSPEPIKYVDLTSSGFSGDLPQENLLRLRLKNPLPEAQSGQMKSLGILTITGTHFFAQFTLMAASFEQSPDSEVEILPAHMLPLVPALPTLSTSQMHAKSIAMISLRENKGIAIAKSQGVSLKLNQIRCVGELLFLDLSFANSAQMCYDIQQLSFLIADKKISRASNFQSFALEVKFSLADLQSFKHQARNIYVLPKAMFSASKRLKITLSEKQPSSRQVSLEISYGELLAADSF